MKTTEMNFAKWVLLTHFVDLNVEFLLEISSLPKIEIFYCESGHCKMIKTISSPVCISCDILDV